eukprot:GFUD01014718.1.p1 GENE.GFUD01014718.1~~GFUD01014718.1.p1  ORF type:complete len:453 (-),score=182.40 GFUD01014718.1:55-1413(-)
MNCSLQRAGQTLLRNQQCQRLLLSRSLVSQAFHCQEAWAARLASPVFQKIRLGEYFVELDRKFATEYRGSALDVDIFAQAVSSPSECEQLEELLFKLRRTPHTAHTPPSTSHAAVRALLAAGEQQEGGEQLHHLVKMLDDRTNYGLFLDDYTTVLILDQMVEQGKLVEGARIASHIMLQEEVVNGPGSMLGNIACWRYCVSGRTESWFSEEEVVVDEDPDEVIRVRAKGMVPNNYEDDHFDLREPDKILGKTLCYLNGEQDNLSRSLNTLGLVLWGKDDQVLSGGEFKMVEEVGKLISEVCTNQEVKAFIEGLEYLAMDVDSELLKKCNESLAAHEKQLVEQQTKLYKEWGQWRDSQLDKEYQMLVRRGRKEAIEQTKQEMAREEEKLFFFDNFDKLEQEKEEKVQDWRKSLPRRNWGQKEQFKKEKYMKEPGQERKEARWEKREAKKGPAK